MKIIIAESTRKNKKYKANVEGEKKAVHFGQKDADDYTKTKEKTQRDSYVARHGSKENWGRSGVMTLGWLSRWLLCEKKTLPAAVRAASDMYRGVNFKLD